MTYAACQEGSGGLAFLLGGSAEANTGWGACVGGAQSAGEDERQLERHHAAAAVAVHDHRMVVPLADVDAGPCPDQALPPHPHEPGPDDDLAGRSLSSDDSQLSISSRVVR